MASEQDKINYQRLIKHIIEAEGQFGRQQQRDTMDAFFHGDMGYFLSIFVDDDGYIDLEEGEIFGWLVSFLKESKDNPEKIVDLLSR